MESSSPVSKRGTRGRESKSKAWTREELVLVVVRSAAHLLAFALCCALVLSIPSTAIKAICLKSALKKATQSAPGGVPRVPKTPAQLAAIEQAAANPPWLTEVAEYMSAHPDQPCRYTTIEDLLHPNSISRFHFLIKVRLEQTRR